MSSVYRWSDLPTDHPMPLIDRQRVIGDRMMISRVVLHPGFTIPSHRHDNEQMVVMLEGRAEFVVGEGAGARTIELRGGGVLHLRGGDPHSCRAIERCVILDLFSPVSAGTGVDAVGASA